MRKVYDKETLDEFTQVRETQDPDGKFANSSNRFSLKKTNSLPFSTFSS
jgi:hypothetical protein